ncbi:hypothetical protein D5086_002646 [Populus alba]|uniref:Uncharacterized protein n=1 Tax=Populus alba TaxID=43335 RepID=A0ACC4D243_POPAL
MIQVNPCHHSDFTGCSNQSLSSSCQIFTADNSWSDHKIPSKTSARFKYNWAYRPVVFSSQDLSNTSSELVINFSALTRLNFTTCPSLEINLFACWNFESLLEISLSKDEARPLSSSRLSEDVNVGEIEGHVGGFSARAVKNSGPSPGIGHQYKNLQSLGGATKSGPSPGEGHRQVTNVNKP